MTCQDKFDDGLIKEESVFSTQRVVSFIPRAYHVPKGSIYGSHITWLSNRWMDLNAINFDLKTLRDNVINFNNSPVRVFCILKLPSPVGRFSTSVRNLVRLASSYNWRIPWESLAGNVVFFHIFIHERCEFVIEFVILNKERSEKSS